MAIQPPLVGDKFGESLGGSQAPPSFWEVPGLPRKFPELPRRFFGDFPGGSLTVELSSNPGVPRKFPRLPRKFPKLPRKFPGLPRRSALSLGSLTPSSNSQKLSLISTRPQPTLLASRNRDRERRDWIFGRGITDILGVFSAEAFGAVFRFLQDTLAPPLQRVFHSHLSGDTCASGRQTFDHASGCSTGESQ